MSTISFHTENKKTNFKGCIAVIRDAETSEKLLETIVLEHNQGRKIISVSDPKNKLFGLNKVAVLILGNDTAYDYSGSTRRMLSGDQLDIALYKCTTTPIRSQSRFPANSEAWVESIDEPIASLARHLPFKVYFLNISATGALIEPLHESFEVGEIFTMRMPLENKDAIIQACVVRIEQGERQSVRYGCKFLSVE